MNEYELYHHGVKGMKWGVRRAERKAAKEAKKKKKAEVKRQRSDTIDRYATKRVTWNSTFRAHNRAADIHGAKGGALDKINKKYENVDLFKDKAARKKYVKEYADSWNSVLLKEVRSEYGIDSKTLSDEDLARYIPTYISEMGVQELIASYD